MVWFDFRSKSNQIKNLNIKIEYYGNNSNRIGQIHIKRFIK